MGARRRQSNGGEYCPRCSRFNAVRFAATSHYEAHVRHGELIAEGERIEQGSRRYLIPEDQRATIFEGEWWQRGFHIHWSDLAACADDADRSRKIEDNRIQYFVRISKRRW